MSEPSKKEIQRIKVLWDYDVLDTVPERVFDDLTELAAKICNAPIALISLIDEERQWFKAKVGISVQETSRDISFCSHAIQSDGLFLVPNAAKDPRFAQNPLVTSDPKIRFYAGMPLVTPDGHALGTLCVIDKVPRQLRPEQEQALIILARHVMIQLEIRRHAKELAETRRTQDEMVRTLEQTREEVNRLRQELSDAKSAKAVKKPQKR
ncbi:MAG: GAF domain-containing protein [Verrucomicrobiota bacterium]